LKQQKEKEMQITDIKIRKAFEEGPMKAVVSVTFDNQFAVHDIKVIYANEKHFIVMPSRKNADGTYRDIAHPINSEFRAEMEREILARYHEEAESLIALSREETAL
jgi:stage V sporulation protein G